jgi:hypothetical protein
LAIAKSLQNHQTVRGVDAPCATSATLSLHVVQCSRRISAGTPHCSSTRSNERDNHHGRIFAPLDGEQVDSHNCYANHVENRRETTTSMRGGTCPPNTIRLPQ